MAPRSTGKAPYVRKSGVWVVPLPGNGERDVAHVKSAANAKLVWLRRTQKAMKAEKRGDEIYFGIPSDR